MTAMNREFYESPKSSKLMRFFWRAAGADRYILERSTYGDQVKYLCLGGIIIATGLMAGLAGGYAMYTIFEPRGNALNSFKTAKEIAGTYDATHIPTMVIAIIFGIIWGLIIFNIDRFIVTSTGKGDGTEEITSKEIKGALPRIIMGAIIALTISKPVEIRMFKTEIDVKLHEKQMEQQQAYKAKTDSLFNSEINNKNTEIKKVEDQLAALRERHTYLQTEYVEEVKKVKEGPRALAIKAQMNSVKDEIGQLEQSPRYLGLRKDKERIEEDRQKRLAESEKVASGLDGLVERIKIAHEVSGFTISLFITLLFMAIELTPIFFKLMLIKSPYDYLDENIKELIKAEQGIEITHNYYKDEHLKGIERDKVVHHQVLRLLKEKVAILEAQTRLSEKAVESWEEKKNSQIDDNPGAFVTETSPA